MKAYFDPGGACSGYAVFDGAVLVECGLSRTKAKDLSQRARDHRSHLLGRLKALGEKEIRILAEMMWHRGRRGAPPQDLLHINLISGHVGTEWILPHTWKGMTPKEIHQPKVLAALSKKELELVEQIRPISLRHNAIDAVGIGLYDVGRGLMKKGSGFLFPQALPCSFQNNKAFVVLPVGTLRRSRRR